MLDSYSILLVEDVSTDAALIELCLKDCGARRIAVASCLREALLCIENDPPDLVLLDLNLPDSHGMRTIEAIARARPELPVVVLTGFGADDVVIAAEAVRNGAQDFIPKDHLEPEGLARAIRFAIERKHRERRQLHHLDHDLLTGLPRPSLLDPPFKTATARALRSAHLIALLMLGLRGFAQLRDEWGADWADELCVMVSARLKKKVRRQDVLAYGGDARFLVLVQGLHGPAQVERVAHRLLQVTEEPFLIADQPHQLSLSVGGALWHPDRPLPLSQLEEEADKALGRALLKGEPLCLGPVEAAA